MGKTEEKDGERKDPGEEIISIETLKSLKKPIYGISLLLGLIGIFLTIIIAIVANGILEEGERTIVLQMNAAIGTIDSVESTVASVSEASGNINTTVSDTKAAIGSMKTGIGLTGTSLTSFGSAMKTISFGVVGLSSYGDQVTEAGAALTDAAEKMETVESDLEETAESTAEIKTQIIGIKESIDAQGDVLKNAKSDVISIFGSLKMANILFAVMLMLMFSVLIMNSLGGFL
jgi:hypothetical protein